MPSAAEILESLKILTGETFIKSSSFIVWYGSRLKGRDNDLLIVTPAAQPTSRVILGDFDLIVASMEQFTNGLSYWDPIFTEPLLTGSVISAASISWDDLKVATCRKKMSLDCPVKLGNIAEKTLLFCKKEAKQSIKQVFEYKDSLMINISWAYSYLGFADIYSENYPICTYKDLLEIAKVKYVREFNDDYLLMKKQDSTISYLKIYAYLEDLFDLIENLKNKVWSQHQL